MLINLNPEIDSRGFIIWGLIVGSAEGYYEIYNTSTNEYSCLDLNIFV